MRESHVIKLHCLHDIGRCLFLFGRPSSTLFLVLSANRKKLSLGNLFFRGSGPIEIWDQVLFQPALWVCKRPKWIYGMTFFCKECSNALVSNRLLDSSSFYIWEEDEVWLSPSHLSHSTHSFLPFHVFSRISFFNPNMLLHLLELSNNRVSSSVRSQFAWDMLFSLSLLSSNNLT